MKRPGTAINKWGDLALAIKTEEFLFIRNRPVHFAWIQNMSFHTLSNLMERGLIRVCIEDLNHKNEVKKQKSKYDKIRKSSH